MSSLTPSIVSILCLCRAQRNPSMTGRRPIPVALDFDRKDELVSLYLEFRDRSPIVGHQRSIRHHISTPRARMRTWFATLAKPRSNDTIRHHQRPLFSICCWYLSLTSSSTMVVLEAPVVGKRVHDVPRKRVRMVYEDDPLHERT